MSNYYLGQGKVYLAGRTAAGAATALRWLGDVSTLNLSLKTDLATQKENYSGQAATVKNIVVGKDATADMTLMELSKENLAFGLQGKTSTIESSSITGEALPLGLVAGDRVALKYPKPSAVIITDSSPQPATVDESKYEVDPVYGAITFTSVTGLIQPLTVAYTHGAVDSVAMFNATAQDFFLRYEGINLAEEGAPIIVELYKVSTEPFKQLSLIGTKFDGADVTASVLIDTSRPVDDELGQFGRILQLAPATA
jgi:hypothetical protein